MPHINNMLRIHSPLSGDNPLRPKSGRRPLQPKNTEIQILKPKQKQQLTDIPVIADNNKENRHRETVFNVTPQARKKAAAAVVEALDASLAEELSAIRKKMERVRSDREKTEKMLGEREKLLDVKMKEMEERGLAQKILEIEVDRLFRLKELHSYSMRISPIRSLREKEHEKKSSETEISDELEESMADATLQSPCSSSNSNSVS